MSTILEARFQAGKRALLIEAEDATRRLLQLLLQGWRFEVRAFSHPTPALADGYADTSHVLLVAHRLPEAEGSAILVAMRQRGWEGRSILIAESRTGDLVEHARQVGFSAVLGKPVGRLDLLEALVK